jgi:carbon monoxide dehydrogenase subunit G
MRLHGSIPSTCPPENLLHLLGDPTTLGKIAPEGFVFAESRADTVPFTFRRRIGVIVLNLAGQMTLLLTADKASGHIDIQADHRIGGGVSIGLDVVQKIGPDGRPVLAWTGVMTARGLTARIVKDRAAEADKIVQTLFERVVALAAD